jgi:hypothetical protein
MYFHFFIRHHHGLLFKKELNMKSADEILKKLNEVCSDERLSYEPANVFANAPLALIQTSLETQRDVLQWVLNIDKKDKKEDENTGNGKKS